MNAYDPLSLAVEAVTNYFPGGVTPHFRIVEAGWQNGRGWVNKPGHAMCGAGVRGGGHCELSPDHRGYHSTVVEQCEDCGRWLQASKVERRVLSYGMGDTEYIRICWYCANVAWKTKYTEVSVPTYEDMYG